MYTYWNAYFYISVFYLFHWTNTGNVVDLFSALRHRVKSLGNLYDLGNPNYQFTLDTTTGQLQRSHTIAERPMSMYVDGSQLYNVQTTPYGLTKVPVVLLQLHTVHKTSLCLLYNITKHSRFTC